MAATLQGLVLRPLPAIPGRRFNRAGSDEGDFLPVLEGCRRVVASRAGIGEVRGRIASSAAERMLRNVEVKTAGDAVRQATQANLIADTVQQKRTSSHQNATAADRRLTEVDAAVDGANASEGSSNGDPAALARTGAAHHDVATPSLHGAGPCSSAQQNAAAAASSAIGGHAPVLPAPHLTPGRLAGISHTPCPTAVLQSTHRVACRRQTPISTP